MPFITRLIHEKCPGWEYTVIKINNGIFDCGLTGQAQAATQERDIGPSSGQARV